MIRGLLFVILVTLMTTCQGLELALKRNKVTGGLVCGVLYCTLEGSFGEFESIEDPFQAGQSFSSVFSMTLFRLLPDTSSLSSSGSGRRRSEQLASVEAEQPKLTKFTEDFNALGILEPDRKFMRMHLLNQIYCRSDFACQVRGTDSEGKEVVITTNLVQFRDEEDEKHDQDSLDSSFPREILTSVRQTDTKMMQIMRILRDLNSKVGSVGTMLRGSVVALEQRLGDKLTSRLEGIEDQLASEVSSDAENKDSLASSLTDLSVTTDRLERTLNNTADMLLSQASSKAEPETCGLESFNVTFEALASRLESVLESQPSAPSGDAVFPGVCRKVDPVVQVKGEGGILSEPFPCDMATQDGGWIVIQRRVTGNVDFHLRWDDYKNGFGTFDDEFWLGNEKIHAITCSATHELRVELEYNGERHFAHYEHFSLGNEASGYRLSVGGYSGTSGDSLSRHDGFRFSTVDRDNDSSFGRNCAERYLGAWWYINCHDSNLNGKWAASNNQGIVWSKFTGQDSASFSEMKIRRVED